MTFGIGLVPGAPHTMSQVKRFDPDLLAGVFGTLVCIAVGAPVLMVQLGGGQITLVPGWVWWVCFITFVTAMVTSSWFIHLIRRRVLLGAFAAQVSFGALVVLLAPRVGWTSILLVFTAAISGYVVTWRTTLGIVALNTAVVAVAAVLVSAPPIEALLTAMLYLLLQIASVLGVMAQRREVETRRKLAEAHIELRAASALLADSTRADERLRIARELHDLLTVLTLKLEIASHQSTPPESEHVTRASRVARELLTDVRSTVGELRRRAPDLRQTLERIVAELPEPRVHLRVDDAVRVDESRTTALIRCVQEVVTNTIRHSEATQLWIEISTDDRDDLTFTAWDDGQGTDRVVPGNGLRGIIERVEEFGGSARFSTGRGFRVVAEVPAA